VSSRITALFVGIAALALSRRSSNGWLRNEIVGGQAANQNNISRIVSWEIDNGARHGEVVQSD